MSTSTAKGESRHALVVGTRWLLPLAIGMALLGAALAHSMGARIVAGLFAVLGFAAWRVQERMRPTLVFDEAGYAIEQSGAEKLRVAWSEVIAVRVDRKRLALYIDCGDKARNLFVPPARGYGFSFADPKTICGRVVDAVPAERITDVESLDEPAP
ncbi:MAG: hypothetical protein JWN44_6895 [Myxococcales bacterium]|nr:hypothetical protein [Myxococcales bacterium]